VSLRVFTASGVQHSKPGALPDLPHAGDVPSATYDPVHRPWRSLLLLDMGSARGAVAAQLHAVRAVIEARAQRAAPLPPSSTPCWPSSKREKPARLAAPVAPILPALSLLLTALASPLMLLPRLGPPRRASCAVRARQRLLIHTCHEAAGTLHNRPCTCFHVQTHLQAPNASALRKRSQRLHKQKPHHPSG